jgi:hypothetical protein
VALRRASAPVFFTAAFTHSKNVADADDVINPPGAVLATLCFVGNSDLPGWEEVPESVEE